MNAEFRVASQVDQLARIGQLLRAYQEEVDKLTKFSKLNAERLVEIIKSVDLPDPAVAFASIIADKKRIEDLESEVRKLVTSNIDYEKEFKILKNQEITVRRLEEENKSMASKMEIKLSSSIESIRSEMQSNYDALLLKAKSREKDLLSQLTQQTAATSALQQSFTEVSSKLLELSQKQESLTSVSNNDDLLNELQAAHDIILSLKSREQVIIREVEVASDYHLKKQLIEAEETNRNEKRRSDLLESKLQSLNEILVSKERDIELLLTRPTRDEFENLQKSFHVLQLAQMDAVANTDEFVYFCICFK